MCFSGFKRPALLSSGQFWAVRLLCNLVQPTCTCQQLPTTCCPCSLLAAHSLRDRQLKPCSVPAIYCCRRTSHLALFVAGRWGPFVADGKASTNGRGSECGVGGSSTAAMRWAGQRADVPRFSASPISSCCDTAGCGNTADCTCGQGTSTLANCLYYSNSCGAHTLTG